MENPASRAACVATAEKFELNRFSSFSRSCASEARGRNERAWSALQRALASGSARDGERSRRHGGRRAGCTHLDRALLHRRAQQQLVRRKHGLGVARRERGGCDGRPCVGGGVSDESVAMFGVALGGREAGAAALIRLAALAAGVPRCRTTAPQAHSPHGVRATGSPSSWQFHMACNRQTWSAKGGRPRAQLFQWPVPSAPPLRSLRRRCRMRCPSRCSRCSRC